jgi:hypothetical protein
VGKHGAGVEVGWEGGVTSEDGMPEVFRGVREMDKSYLL